MTPESSEALGEAPVFGYIGKMGLRDTLKKKLSTVVNRLSGEYSAGSSEIRPDTPPVVSGEEVKVTRARLRRPGAANEN